MTRTPQGWLRGQQAANSAQAIGHEQRGYQPSQCRTRRCTLTYAHPGQCNIPQPSLVRIPSGAGNRAGRRAARRAAGVHGVNHEVLHGKRRRAQVDPKVRERMERTREHQPQRITVK